MKYIFLDIDGVLNAPGDKNLIEGVIDKNKYSLLIQIINKTNAKVVIISSRRLYQEDRNILLKGACCHGIWIMSKLYEQTYRRNIYSYKTIWNL